MFTLATLASKKGAMDAARLGLMPATGLREYLAQQGVEAGPDLERYELLQLAYEAAVLARGCGRVPATAWDDVRLLIC